MKVCTPTVLAVAVIIQYKFLNVGVFQRKMDNPPRVIEPDLLIDPFVEKRSKKP